MRKYTILFLIVFTLTILTGCSKSKLDLVFENSFKMYESGVNLSQKEELEIKSFKFQKIKEFNYLISVNSSEINIQSHINNLTSSVTNILKIHKEDFDEVSQVMSDLIDKNILYNTTFDSLSKIDKNENIVLPNDVEITLLNYDEENEIIEIKIKLIF